MSLQPELNYTVPELTARVARASFPNGTLCLKIYDELGTIFRDQDFADLFPQRGQPACAPFRLALVTVLQFLENLPDRAAADAVRARIDWKYLLCLELDDPGFDPTVLCEFRARLVEGSAEHRLFDTLLRVLVEQKLVKKRGRQRTDSTHVLAAIRGLNHLVRVVETLRATLNTLSTVAPDWVRENIPPEWVRSYGVRAEEGRLPESDTDRAAFAEKVGADGHRLLDTIYGDGAPVWLRQIPMVETLRVVWVQNFVMVDGVARRRDKDNRPPMHKQIDSPYDIEARYAKKRETTWVGYKVHLTESCDEESPRLITNVDTADAQEPDNDALPDIHESLAAADLLPDRHLVDTGYVEAKRLVESRRDYRVDLFGPAPGNRFWQALENTGYDSSHFTIDWEREVVTCPQGKTSLTWKPAVAKGGDPTIHVQFAKADCSPCPVRSQCTRSAIQRRTLNIKPQLLHEALQEARRRERTEEFKEAYKLRAGVEGSISQGVRAFGLRRSRYVGMAKAHLQHLAIATAMNLVRVYAWLNGETPEATRKSAFVRTMEPLAA